MSTSRFTFPGFTPVRRADTPPYEVEIGRITQGDGMFVVRMFRRDDLSFEGNFLVERVMDGSETVSFWEFPKGSFIGLGLLAKAGDETVIALVGKRDGKVERIVPLSTLGASNPVNLRWQIELKRLAAEYLGRRYNLTDVERKIVQRDYERRREVERAEQARKREVREQARITLVKRIVARGKVEAYTLDGGKRFGLPVVGEEWQALQNGTYVVLVENYDDETGQIGEPIRAFQVRRERGKNPQEWFAASVTWEHPNDMTEEPAAPHMPEPAGEMVIETKDGIFEVAVYATKNEIDAAHAGGLNSGSYVTARDKYDGTRYEVYAVHADDIKTLGLFEPIA